MRILVLLSLAVAVISGCASQIPAYAPDGSIASTLSGARSKLSVVADAPGFADQGSIVCRAVGPVTLAQGQTFSQYVSDALRSELAAAAVYEPTSVLRLKSRLLRVDFQTTLGATNWYIDGEYGIGGDTFFISTIYHDRSSYLGSKACSNMALYFRPAVMQHVREVLRHHVVRSRLGLSPDMDAKTGPTSTADRLRQLESLLRQGLLTQEEYESRRRQLLNEL